ncbi:unnamed protein product [Arctogadus glacialis]
MNYYSSCNTPNSIFYTVFTRDVFEQSVGSIHMKDYLGKVLESSGDDGVRVGKVLNLVNPAATGTLSLGTAFEKKGTHD